MVIAVVDAPVVQVVLVMVQKVAALSALPVEAFTLF